MKLLLDTHIFLWFISGETRLPVGWREDIRDAGNEVYLSVISVCQALEHGLTLVTIDPVFEAYPAPVLGRT